MASQARKNYKSRRPSSSRRNDFRNRSRKSSGPSTKALQNLASVYPQVNADTSDAEAVDYLPALFNLYPQLIDQIPWMSLRGNEEASTPLMLRRSQHLFGQNHVFWKEESLDADFLPEHLARKLEFSFGRLRGELKPGKKILISGYADSPYALNTFRLAKALDLKPQLFLLKSRLSKYQLARLYQIKEEGYKVQFFETKSRLDWSLKNKRFLSRFISQLVLDFNGESSEAALGYLSAFLELSQQQLRNFDFIMLPVDSGISLLGLELGRRLLGLKDTKIIGFSTRHEPEMLTRKLADHGNQLIRDLGSRLGQSISEELKPEHFHILSAVEQPLEKNLRWMNRFQDLESRAIDLLRVAPAMTRASEYVLENKFEGKRILLWNTTAHLPVNEPIFDIENLKLPRALKAWPLTPELAALIH